MRVPKRSHCKGFTLIEVLVSLSLIVVIGGVIAAALAGAVRVWETAEVFDRLQMSTALGMERLQTDLRNAIPFHVIRFTGRKDSMVLCGTETPDGPGKMIEEIEYRFDESTRSLIKSSRRWPYGITTAKVIETVFEDVRSAEFSYASRLAGNPEELVWTYEWTGDDVWLPAAVKIDMQLENGSDTLPMSRTIYIPANPHVYQDEKEEDEKTGSN